MFHRVQVSSPGLAALSPGLGPLEAPTQWDVSAWGLATSLGFGMLGCWLSWRTATRAGAEERSKLTRQKQFLRFVAEVLKLELATHSLAAIIPSDQPLQIETAMKQWHIVATNVHILARQHLGFDGRREAELRNRIASAQAHYELSRMAITRGKPAAEATSEFHRSAERVNDVASELRAVAEHMVDRP